MVDGGGLTRLEGIIEMSDNERLFHRWRDACYKLTFLCAIVQNEGIEISTEDAVEWLDASQQQIDQLIQLRDEIYVFVSKSVR